MVNDTAALSQTFQMASPTQESPAADTGGSSPHCCELGVRYYSRQQAGYHSTDSPTGCKQKMVRHAVIYPVRLVAIID